MKVSTQDAAFIRDLYESDGYQALTRLLEARKIDLAVSGLNSANLEQLYMHKGQVAEIDWLLKTISDLYKKGN